MLFANGRSHFASRAETKPLWQRVLKSRSQSKSQTAQPWSNSVFPQSVAPSSSSGPEHCKCRQAPQARSTHAPSSFYRGPNLRLKNRQNTPRHFEPLPRHLHLRFESLVAARIPNLAKRPFASSVRFHVPDHLAAHGRMRTCCSCEVTRVTTPHSAAPHGAIWTSRCPWSVFSVGQVPVASCAISGSGQSRRSKALSRVKNMVGYSRCLQCFSIGNC